MTLQEQVETKVFFDSENFDWDTYLKHRPLYRDNLYKLVLDFHASGAIARYETAWDAGCGIGHVAVKLAEWFGHVYATDPSSRHIAQAERYVNMFSGHVSTAVRKAEDGLDVDDGTIDHFVIAEALHWTDAQQVIAAAGRKLRSGGTFAAWQYGTRCYFVDEDPGSVRQRLLDQLWQLWNAAMTKIAGFETSRAREIMNSRFDCLVFDAQEWHTEAIQKWSFSPDRPMLDEVIVAECARDNKVNYSDAAEVFWCDADIAWISQYFNHLYPDMAFVEHHKEAIDALRKVLGENKKYKIAFPGALILVRKR